MDEGRAHEVIATNCVYFILCFRGSLDGPEASSSNDMMSLRQSRPFFYYARRHWDNHAREVDYESKLTDLIVLILKAELGLRNFLGPAAESGDRRSPDISPLYFAAAMELYWPCKKLAQSGAYGNGQEGHWGSALHAASTCENENIIRLLLDYGANINLEAGVFGTALHIAILCSNEKTVRFLLHHGADVNARGGIYGTPLQWAIDAGRSHIVQLLLHHGADVISEVGYYDTWIQRGNSEIAVILLPHGAVMSKFGGGIEAREALARKDFQKFVAIQVEVLLKKEREKARTWERFSSSKTKDIDVRRTLRQIDFEPERPPKWMFNPRKCH